MRSRRCRRPRSTRRPASSGSPPRLPMPRASGWPRNGRCARSARPMPRIGSVPPSPMQGGTRCSRWSGLPGMTTGMRPIWHRTRPKACGARLELRRPHDSGPDPAGAPHGRLFAEWVRFVERVKPAANGHSAPPPGSPYAGRRGSLPPRPPTLTAEASAAERERLLDQLSRIEGSDDLAVWAHRALPLKNTLTTDDALAIEAAFACRLGELGPAAAAPSYRRHSGCRPPSVDPGAPSATVPAPANMGLPPSGDPPSTTEVGCRRRPAGCRWPESAKAAAEPQLKPAGVLDRRSTRACWRSPSPSASGTRSTSSSSASSPASSAAVYLRTPITCALPSFVRSDGRSVTSSPCLCAGHIIARFHRFGDEQAWWGRNGLDPLRTAAALWRTSNPLPIATNSLGSAAE